jgi:hypothetical protein
MHSSLNRFARRLAPRIVKAKSIEVHGDTCVRAREERKSA